MTFFRNLKDIVEENTNMEVLIVDILCQSSGELNGRREAPFDYHVYLELERVNIKIFVIFIVTHTNISYATGP